MTHYFGHGKRLRKYMACKMTRGTFIAGSGTAILKAVNNGNAWFLQCCKNHAATQY